jgi:hypothetical protein
MRKVHPTDTSFETSYSGLIDRDVSEENYASVKVEVQQTLKIEAVCFSETSVSHTRCMVSQLRRLGLKQKWSLKSQHLQITQMFIILKLNMCLHTEYRKYIEPREGLLQKPEIHFQVANTSKTPIWI